MYKVEYLPEAIDDMLQIEDYLSAYSITAADEFAETLEEQTATLVEYPLVWQAFDADSFF